MIGYGAGKCDLCFGISYSGSTRPWGGCSPGSIPGIPTGKMDEFLFFVRNNLFRHFERSRGILAVEFCASRAN